MSYRLDHGVLVRVGHRLGPTVVTAPYCYYQGLTVPRLALIWFLTYGQWPQGYVYSIDETDHPASLRVSPAKNMGVFTPGLKESDR